MKRAYPRTFCIGAFFPAGASLFTYQSGLFSGFVKMWYAPLPSANASAVFVIFTAIVWGMSLAVGLIACGVRWSLEASQRQQRQAMLRRQDRPAGDPWESPPRG